MLPGFKTGDIFSDPGGGPFYAPPFLIGNRPWLASTGGLTVDMPTGHQSGDLVLLFTASHDGRTTSLISIPSGWTEIYRMADGSAGGAQSTISYRWMTSSSEPAVNVGSGGGGMAHTMAIRNVDPASPFASNVEIWRAETSGGAPFEWPTYWPGTNFYFPALVTTVNNALVILQASNGTDASSGTSNPWRDWTHPGLTELTERIDWVQPWGLGSGLGVATGIREFKGNIGVGSCTHYVADSRPKTIVFALAPKPS